LNWNPPSWKRPAKLLLGFVTIWPLIYMFLFMASIFSLMFFLPFAETESSIRRCGEIDVLQLDDKIKAGEISELTVKRDEVKGLDRIGNCEFRVSVSNQATRDRILRTAREPNPDGRARVSKIQEETSEPVVSPIFPIGMVIFFGTHMLTILLMMALLPLYIILAVKDERHDQTMRIIWVVLFCTVNMFAMPVYWYLYVGRKAGRGPGVEAI
jgi:hypothetical protein